MTEFGYHASHEQYAPSELLANVRMAEQAGFRRAMCSDHFHPWTEEQGHSGFTWSWLGAALEATTLTFGTVNAPGARYHPAVIAQAAATLADMYPQRFWLAVGSGELLNESIVGGEWPDRAHRNARLRECVHVMRALWRGETVSHRGVVTVNGAKLYSLPAVPPLLFGAALSEGTAEFVGSWADGLITIGAEPDALRALIDAFRRGGGDGKPVYIQHTLSWATTHDAALRAAHEQWRFSALGGDVLANLSTPNEFARAARAITPYDVARGVFVSADVERHIARLADYVELGVDAVYVHNVNRNQQPFLEQLGPKILAVGGLLPSV